MFWNAWFKSNKKEMQLDNVRAVIVTDKGMVRSNNEDAAIFINPSKKNAALGFLGIVADGMGGHLAGEVASHLAIEIIQKEYYNLKENPQSALQIAFNKANKAVWQKGKGHSSYKGMGTTCTAVAILNNTLYLAQIGDSRLYILKKGVIEQLSTDHTYVQELVSQGVISTVEAAVHPERNVLTRVLGTHQQVAIDINKVKDSFDEGDRLLLCSDGLYEYFSQDELADFLSQPDISLAAHKLVDTAKNRGGHDNITAMVVEKSGKVNFRRNRPTEEIVLP